LGQSWGQTWGQRPDPGPDLGPGRAERGNGTPRAGGVSLLLAPAGPGANKVSSRGQPPFFVAAEDGGPRGARAIGPVFPVGAQ
jgi:hypothetical protein